MRIIQANISNYRNIDGVSVIFNPNCSYLIGENNLGKSNLLSLLETVCNAKSFVEKDYFDSGKAIEIELTIEMREEELGFFDDHFSPENSNHLTIKFFQTIDEAYPSIVNLATDESIAAPLIRRLNFLKYETTDDPNKTLKLNTQKGAGVFIRNIVKRFVESKNKEEDLSFLNNTQIDTLLEFINDEHLNKIKSFNDYSIRATIAHDPSDMLMGLFHLSDGERKIDSTGSGVQFMAMASINVLCRIMELYDSKRMQFTDLLYTKPNEQKFLPLVLAIDEPEVHLHPYLQRSLINYYKRILCNHDEGFVELLKTCFDIDGLDGQLIIVTHSTDALIGDYKNIVRFYQEDEQTKVISGADPKLEIKNAIEKHLIMHFPEVKEAFYSHCAIFVEGETEYGCIHKFAEKKGISLDDFAICVINARGEGSISPLRKLFDAFKIPSIAIYDGDVKLNGTPSAEEFYTDELCFEIEIIETLYNAGRCDLIEKIALEMDSSAMETIIDKDFVRKPFKKMKKDLADYSPKALSGIDRENKDEYIEMYASWYMVKKGVLLGRIIGEIVPAELIPNCYSKAIDKAREVSTNA